MNFNINQSVKSEIGLEDKKEFLSVIIDTKPQNQSLQ